MDIFAYLNGNSSSKQQNQQQPTAQSSQNPQRRPLLRSETDVADSRSKNQHQNVKSSSASSSNNAAAAQADASKTPMIRRAVSSLIDYSRRPVFLTFSSRQLTGLESSALRLGLSSAGAAGAAASTLTENPLMEVDDPTESCGAGCGGPLNYLHADEGFVRSPPPIHLDRIKRMTSRDRSFLRSPTSPVAMAGAAVADRLSESVGLGSSGSLGGSRRSSNGDAMDEVLQLRQSIERMRLHRSSLSSSRLDEASGGQQQQSQQQTAKKQQPVNESVSSTSRPTKAAAAPATISRNSDISKSSAPEVGKRTSTLTAAPQSTGGSSVSSNSISAPASTPLSAPASAPASVPASAPASVPASAPSSTPASAPASAPKSTSGSSNNSTALASRLTLTSSKPTDAVSNATKTSENKDDAGKASQVDELLESLAFNSIQGALTRFSTVSEAEAAFNEEDSRLQAALKEAAVFEERRRLRKAQRDNKQNKAEVVKLLLAKGGGGSSGSGGVAVVTPAARGTTESPLTSNSRVSASAPPRDSDSKQLTSPAVAARSRNEDRTPKESPSDEKPEKSRPERSSTSLPATAAATATTIPTATGSSRRSSRPTTAETEDLPLIADKQKQSLTLSANERLYLDIRVRRGISRRNVQLCRADGQPIDSTQFRLSVIGESLRIDKRQLTMDDMGAYRVQVDDGAGKSETVEFDVWPPRHAKLTVLESLTDVAVQEGGQLKLECQIAGLCDKCSLQWRCPPQSYRYKTITERGPNSAKVWLTVARLRRDDAGEYRLSVQHDAEMCECSATVTVTDRTLAAHGAATGGGGSAGSSGGGSGQSRWSRQASGDRPAGTAPSSATSVGKSSAVSGGDADEAQKKNQTKTDKSGGPENAASTVTKTAATPVEAPTVTALSASATKRTVIIREAEPKNQDELQKPATSSKLITETASKTPRGSEYPHSESAVTDFSSGNRTIIVQEKQELSDEKTVEKSCPQASASTAETARDSVAPLKTVTVPSAGSKRTVIVREVPTEKQGVSNDTSAENSVQPSKTLEAPKRTVTIREVKPEKEATSESTTVTTTQQVEAQSKTLAAPSAPKKTIIIRETTPERREETKDKTEENSFTTASKAAEKTEASVTPSKTLVASTVAPKKTAIVREVTPTKQERSNDIAAAKSAAEDSATPKTAPVSIAQSKPVSESSAAPKRTVIVREKTPEKLEGGSNHTKEAKSVPPPSPTTETAATLEAPSKTAATPSDSKTTTVVEEVSPEKQDSTPDARSVTFTRRPLSTLKEEPTKEVIAASDNDENDEKLLASSPGHTVCNKPQINHSNHLRYQMEASKTVVAEQDDFEAKKSATHQPEFQSPLPETLCVDELQEIHLSVVAKPDSGVGNGLVSRWLFEGKPIDDQSWDSEVSEAPDGTFCLVVDRARASFSGEYTAVLELRGAKASSSTSSSTCLVTVHEAQPLVGRHFPAQVRLREGDSSATTVACQLNAASNVRTRVRKDGRLMSLDPSRFELSLNEETHCCSLRLKGLRQSDSGKYEIVFSNRTGRTASSLNIQVVPTATTAGKTDTPVVNKEVETVSIESDEAPVQLELEIELADQSATVGDKDLKLACSLRKPDKDSVALWFFNTEPISDEKPFTDGGLVQTFDGKTASLTFRQLTLSHNGVYSCGVKNSISQVVSKCHLSVKPIATVPVISKRLESLRVKEGDTIVLQVELAATDRDCTVRWYQNDEDLCRVSGLQMEFNGRIARLVIRDAYLNDSGRYKVVMTNEAGLDRSECSVEVDEKPMPPPRIVKPLQSCRERVGQPLTLSCEVENPPSKGCRVDWYFDDSLIDVDSTNLDIANHDSTISLTIGCLTEGDEGQYTVRIANKSGEASSQCNVTVERPQRGGVQSDVNSKSIVMSNEGSSEVNVEQCLDQELLSKLLMTTDDFDLKKKIRNRLKELHELEKKSFEEKRKANVVVDHVASRARQADEAKARQLQAYQEMAKTASVGSVGSEDSVKLRAERLQKEREAEMQAYSELAKIPGVGSLQGGPEKVKQLDKEAAEQSKARQLKQFDDMAKHVDTPGTIVLNEGGNSAAPAQSAMSKFKAMDRAANKSQDPAAAVPKKTGSSLKRSQSAAVIQSSTPAAKQWQTAAAAATASTGPPGAAKPAIPPGGRGGGVKRTQSAASIKQCLLDWCKSVTAPYRQWGVEVTNLSSSWGDGLAFCALIHSFYPEAFNFNELSAVNRRRNFELAFDTAQKYAGIAPLLDVEDMVSMATPDWKCVFTYLQMFYKKFRTFNPASSKSIAE